MAARMNGWRRLWIVIAGLTLVWALLYGLYMAGKNNSPDYGVISDLQNPKCETLRTLKLPKGFELVIESGEACYDLYLHNKYAERPVRTEEEYRQKVAEQLKQQRRQWSETMLIFWAICVGLLYFTGAIIAWILRGFRRGSG